MTLRQGDMFAEPTDVLLVTTNQYVRTDGALVMGRGAALRATQIWPKCELDFGSLVRACRPHSSPYGVLIHTSHRDPILGIFQVKRHFRELADLDLIAYSSEKLRRLALTVWRHECISVNFPGIGWGGRERAAVLPLIIRLPDNVQVWEYK